MASVSGKCDSCNHMVTIEIISVPNGPIAKVNGYKGQSVAQYGRFIESCEHCRVEGNIGIAVCNGDEFRFEIMTTTRKL